MAFIVQYSNTIIRKVEIWVILRNSSSNQITVLDKCNLRFLKSRYPITIEDQMVATQHKKFVAETQSALQYIEKRSSLNCASCIVFMH